MKIVNECQKKSIKVLGLDSFRISAQGIQPFQEFSFDYSNLKKTETWNAIKRDLNRLSESEFVFEITYSYCLLTGKSRSKKPSKWSRFFLPSHPFWTIIKLKKLGCAYVQGYYFSKPVPTEEFDRFLAERSENR